LKRRYFLLLITFVSNNILAQEIVTHHDWVDGKGGHVVDIRETKTKEVIDKPGNPGPKEVPGTQYQQSTYQPLSYPIVPLGYSDGMSESHKSSLKALNNLLMSISGIKTLLAGSILLDFASDNPR
jgi:hypothetical protein